VYGEETNGPATLVDDRISPVAFLNHQAYIEARHTPLTGQFSCILGVLHRHSPTATSKLVAQTPQFTAAHMALVLFSGTRLCVVVEVAGSQVLENLGSFLSFDSGPIISYLQYLQS
jgi:hypothetical protein